MNYMAKEGDSYWQWAPAEDDENIGVLIFYYPDGAIQARAARHGCWEPFPFGTDSIIWEEMAIHE